MPRRQSIFASTKQILQGTADLATDSIHLLQEELKSSTIINKAENISEETEVTLTVYRDLKSLEPKDDFESLLLERAKAALKANLR